MLGAVAGTVNKRFGGVAQHVQNLLTYGDQPSALDFIDMEMDELARTLSIYADLANAPSKLDVMKYCNSLGNPPDMVVTPGSNQKGHGGTAGFHADAKVGLLGAKAGGLYMLGLPQTSGMASYMKVKPLQLGQAVHNGVSTINLVVFATRDESTGKYTVFIPDFEQQKPLFDDAHYEKATKWTDAFLKSVGSSLDAAFTAVFDKLRDTNGICVHYLVLQDHGFATQTFPDGVTKDIVIAKPGEEPLRLSHELSNLFDLHSLHGRRFRINGQIVDMAPLCPTAQKKLFGPIRVVLPEASGTIMVTAYSNDKVDIPGGSIIPKLGPLLLPEHPLDDSLAAVRNMLSVGARFSGPGGVVDKGQLALQFLNFVLQAIGKTVTSESAGHEVLGQKLCTLVKDVFECDAALPLQHRRGLDFLRFVFGVNQAFLVVDIGNKLTTNPTKTGLSEPMSATNRIMAASLLPVWIGLSETENLPPDLKERLSSFRLAKKDKADKAAVTKATNAAKVAKSSSAAGAGGSGAAAGAGTPGPGAAGVGAAGAGPEPASGRGKRKAAVEASKRLKELDMPPVADNDFTPPRAKRTPGASPEAGGLAMATPATAPRVTNAVLVAENGRLKAEIDALKAFNAVLAAQLTAAGLVPAAAPSQLLAIGGAAE